MRQIILHGNTEGVRWLGRLDQAQSPVALDWTGAGLEFRFRGAGCWAELEAPALAPLFWVIVLADGCPVARFPVEPGCRFYPLLPGMEADKARTVTLLKETQCMPDIPEATLLVRSLRLEGNLEPLPDYACRIEFIGDSLTSGEGSLAPRDNEEWVTPWFSAVANYSFHACQLLHAERRVLSQSGWGACWSWEHNPAGNLTDGYERIVGALQGPAAEARGCCKPYDFAAWPADLVCIRLGTNDAGGIKMRDSLEQDGEAVVEGCLRLIRKVRQNNPAAKIVWILPATDSYPQLPAEAVHRAQAQGIENLSAFTLPDYTPADFGARAHPNAAWNYKAGRLLADYLRTLL